ncbi:MAG: thermonuclease family protein [Kiloniellales bacterium]
MLLCLALPSGAAARDEPSLTGLEGGGRATVTEIVDGDTLLLDDGREVRLVGLQAPKLPLGRPDFEAWPLADQAKAALAELALGRMVEPRFGGRRGDRHGRVLAHLLRDDGLWLQGELLRRGLARVYSFADNRALVAEMLALERAARAAGRGIWAEPFYAVRSPDDANDHIGTFQLVEGRALDVALVRGRAYINFGADWRSDFTATLAPAVVRAFAAEGLDPEVYDGRRLRIRGWLKAFNGPMIEITHPEQIEVLEE